MVYNEETTINLVVTVTNSLIFGIIIPLIFQICIKAVAKLFYGAF